METLGPINLGGLILLGAALMWTVRLVYGRRRATADDAVKQLLLIGAWLLVALGAAGVIVGMTGPVSVLIFLAAPVILLILGLCTHVLGFPLALLLETILPGAALSIVIGNFFYAWQAQRLSAASGRRDDDENAARATSSPGVTVRTAVPATRCSSAPASSGARSDSDASLFTTSAPTTAPARRIQYTPPYTGAEIVRPCTGSDPCPAPTSSSTPSGSVTSASGAADTTRPPSVSR